MSFLWRGHSYPRLAFVTRRPGFQCDQVLILPPDNARKRPRNP